MSILFASLALAAAGTPAATEMPIIEGAVVLTMGQIKTYNLGLQSSDPHFIRCVKEEPTGSLVPKRVCRTKGDWDRRAENAQRDAREEADYRLTHTSTHD
jgi:hypothetical protein